MQTKLVKETIEEVTDVSGTCNISTGGVHVSYVTCKPNRKQ